MVVLGCNLGSGLGGISFGGVKRVKEVQLRNKGWKGGFWCCSDSTAS